LPQVAVAALVDADDLEVAVAVVAGLGEFLGVAVHGG
jgi:hypothetical protein